MWFREPLITGYIPVLHTPEKQHGSTSICQTQTKAHLSRHGTPQTPRMVEHRRGQHVTRELLLPRRSNHNVLVRAGHDQVVALGACSWRDAGRKIWSACCSLSSITGFLGGRASPMAQLGTPELRFHHHSTVQYSAIQCVVYCSTYYGGP